MQKGTVRMKTWISVVAIVGLALPMADGCHKHAQVKAKGAAAQLASAR